ncbi:hypothetical protein EGI22_07695 [Lacihabitans sp. LS3-19]|uniref:hypothetical protein n=1 Tax=Lacihabitans sp. LS3-19 TaxID=2487335 RepID=UPI0020CCBD85|nr:hypothetical protein [Lacihabitans sp. LS3-19]MCP9767793.1 hypothetical protein [Lacihabitans sp. LS3-19]
MRKILFLYFLFYGIANGQKPKAKFSSDTILLGKPIYLSLSYLHNGSSDLLFPDSTTNFQPFVFQSSEYFPTKTDKGRSLDSVVYTLVTFKLDSIYKLSIPITFINSKKKVYSDTAKVKLKSLVKATDISNPKAKISTGFFNVPLDFNYPKVLYLIVIIGFGLILLWAVFGKLFNRIFRLWQFQQKHKKFVSSYKKLGKSSDNIENVGKGLVKWKNHLEWLLKKPYSTMTTSEITKNLNNPRLEEALKEFDLAIYGGILSNHIPFAFNILFDFASETFKDQKKRYKAALKNQ